MTKAKVKTAAKVAKGKEDVKNSSAKTVLDAATEQPMCVLPQANVQELFNWLNSDRQLMPHNEVLRCMYLLNEAKLIEFVK
jgi:hypothetical protein